MENIFDRLQFVKHEEVFPTREDAVNYVLGKQIVDRPALLAEPMILLYESDDDVKGPNVILAIGSVGDGTANQANRTFFIDTQKTEEEIIELNEKIEEAIKSLTLIPLESDTIKLSSEKTEEGTFLSGDVKIADYMITSGIVNNNIITTVGDKGIYAFVDMDYDPETFVITFNVNGVTKEFQLPVDQHVVKGWYDPSKESIFLKLADNSKVEIDVVNLIDEWTVLSSASTTPIMLFKEHVSSYTESHDGVYDWQDLLTADVRVADHIPDNILHKDRTGRYLYVKGTADNIKYKEGVTVKEALDNIDCKVSTSTGNLIYKRPDGIYATAMLGYKTAENKITYTYSDGNTGEIKEIEFKLNSVKLLEDITYDPVKEEIVIRYIDAQGEYQRVEIPVADIIEEWDVNNEAHNIFLNKYRSQGQGKDILSADAKIHEGDNNILEDKNHELYVNGISDNIKYDVTGDTTVKDVLDNLSADTIGLNEKLDQEIADREADVERIDNTIGSGFTTDAHETVTYKFEQLQNQVNEEADKLQNEIDRSTAKDTEHDGKIQAIEDEIGEGFGPRNTVRDEIENLQSEIEAVSADSASSLKDIINIDESINIDKADATKPVISVNLSEEIEDDKPNIIKLNADGLYAGVDLLYQFDPEVGTNQLIFKTTNGTKVYDLKTNSVVDKIYYDPSREAIIIEYTVDGRRMPDVVVPVGDLIDEWRVEDGHPHAVQLEKVRVPSGQTGFDVLKASVVINNTHDDNILIMDDDALYVPGADIEQNKLDIVALKDRMAIAEGDIDNLETQLALETERRISGDTLLTERITTEEARARETENRIDAALQQEIARATAKENELNTAIVNETLRAQAADSELYQKIADESAERTAKDAELESLIAQETQRAENAEENITHLIDDEAERRASGDTQLNNKITTEEARARETETRIETALNNEIARAQSKEGELNTAITNETIRANAADNELYQKIADETAERISKDAELESIIAQEASRAQVAETTISERLASEVTRSTDEDARISSALQQEISDRQQGDAELEEEIRASKLTFEDTSSIDFNNPYVENNIVKAEVKLQSGDNIIKLGTGLYATATLEYEPTGNKLRLVTSNGAQDYIQLVGATLLDSIEYDSVNKLLIIKYTDGSGSQRETSVGVTDLWNELIVQNPSEKSAVELTKVIGDPGNPDILSGRVLITDDRDGDGKPDEGSVNIIEIRNNGLFVDGSALSGASGTAECVKNELKSVEKAVLGHIVGEECGEGYVYEQNNQATYINSATSFYNADFILDQNIKRVETEVAAVSAKTDCVDEKADAIYEIMYGAGSTLPECGQGASYQPYVGACIISAATSFNEADHMLNDAICQILTMWTSGKTCTTSSEWVEDGANRKIEVHARLSRGNAAQMSDDDVIIENLSGDYIDPTRNEFTDTNALRIVCLTEGPSGTTPSVDSMQNGIYLSNIWDCGLYYGPSDTEAKAKAEAAGYNTNYSTDESPTATNFNYMNNVR